MRIVGVGVGLGVLLGGCQQVALDRPLGGGRLLIEFEGGSENEREYVRDRMERSGAEAMGEGLRFLVSVGDGRALEIEELCAAIERWHREVASIENEFGVEIVASERVDVGMWYLRSTPRFVARGGDHHADASRGEPVHRYADAGVG